MDGETVFCAFVSWLARRLDDACQRESKGENLGGVVNAILKSREARALYACRGANRAARTIVVNTLAWAAVRTIDMRIEIAGPIPIVRLVAIGTDRKRRTVDHRHITTSAFVHSVTPRRIKFTAHVYAWLRSNKFGVGIRFPRVDDMYVAIVHKPEGRSRIVQPDDPALSFSADADFVHLHDGIVLCGAHFYGTRRLGPPGSRKRKREQK